MKIKKLVFILVISLLTTFTGFNAMPNEVMADVSENGNDPITVMVNNQQLFMDQPPLKMNDRTMVPMRVIFEALSAQIDWDEATQTVTGTKGDTKIVLTIGEAIARKNNETISLDVPAQVTNDRTMVPVRFISEALGAKVDWDEATQTVKILTDSTGGLTDSSANEISQALIPAADEQPATKLEMSSVFADNMVLQQKKKIPVWGRSKKGDNIVVEFAGQSVSTVVQESRWVAYLNPVDAGGPYELNIKSNEDQIVFKDVMVGEVWVCSGQSNMAFKLGNADGGKDEALTADYPNIRYFYQDIQEVESTALDFTNGKWKVCSPTEALSMSAVAYYFGVELSKDLNVPIGLIFAARDGAGIRSFMSPEARQQTQGKTVYNGMIRPLMPYAIQGVIWYQGEADRNENAPKYKDFLTTLITSWRKEFQQGDFPFLFVQLPKYQENGTNYNWCLLREGMMNVLNTVPNTGMAVTVDTGDVTNIHPKDKKPVGERLALIARGMVYQKDVAYRSPLYKEMKIEGNKIIITLNCADNGLEVRGSALYGFEICGDDHKFAEAKAKVIGTNQIEVSSDLVSSPVAVRYAWDTSPDTDLYSKEGLPVGPFRTDDFDPKTEKLN